MGSLYIKNGKLWLRYKTVAGKWIGKPAGLAVGEEDKARELLKKTEAKVKARVDAGETAESGPMTVERYALDWLARRTTFTVQDDEGRLKLHALPALKGLLLDEVRPRHIRSLVRGLAAGGTLAPRSVRNVYGVLRTMFHDAHVDELIAANPCVLKRDDLPKKVDKDPAWRPTAIFVREEIEKLISDDRIPEDRRIIYAVLALGGLRFGEAAALRWSSYDATLEPLGKLVVSSSYSVKKKAVKAVKTERPREVPVHPTLAKLLAQWKLSGWQELSGGAAQSDDLIVPSRLGDHRSVNHALKRFHEDCARIDIRTRRLHDLRRSFITLARTDGARKDVLEVVTHGSRGDIVDVYSSLPWSLLCEEVAKLKIKVLKGEVVALPKIGGGGGGNPVILYEAPEKFATGLATRPFRALAKPIKKPETMTVSGRASFAGWTGLEFDRHQNPNYSPVLGFPHTNAKMLEFEPSPASLEFWHCLSLAAAFGHLMGTRISSLR